MKKLKITSIKNYSKNQNGAFTITCKKCVYKIYVEYNKSLMTVFFDVRRTNKKNKFEYDFNNFAINIFDIITFDLKKRHRVNNTKFDSIFFNDLKKMKNMCSQIINYFGFIKIIGL